MTVSRVAGLSDVRLITGRKHEDARGWFAEIFRASVLEQEGITATFVQENHSFSRLAGTIRGLHIQIEPVAQGKLVRCTAGSVFDVVVDVRPASPSYAAWASVTLSAETPEALWVPPWHLHGFQTLVANAEVTYLTSAEYAPSAERGVRWSDAQLAIPWPLSNPTLSNRDAALPSLADLLSELGVEA